ncbi:hypothetical protein M8J76_000117 [Diaphorina citri]|nr:hypothetical protein M8J75_003331 [Diaphorina citri]KAI5713473.1 hypothetical protein M8J76_000117 [Diaphorina citri]
MLQVTDLRCNKRQQRCCNPTSKPSHPSCPTGCKRPKPPSAPPCPYAPSYPVPPNGQFHCLSPNVPSSPLLSNPAPATHCRMPYVPSPYPCGPSPSPPSPAPPARCRCLPSYPKRAPVPRGRGRGRCRRVACATSPPLRSSSPSGNFSPPEYPERIDTPIPGANAAEPHYDACFPAEQSLCCGKNKKHDNPCRRNVKRPYHSYWRA